MKKIIIIIVVVIGVVAMTVGVYFGWKKAKTILTPPTGPTQTTTSVNQPTTTEQQTAVQKLKIISDQPIFDYWVFYPTATSTSKTIATSTLSSSHKIFYISQEGKIFGINEEGKAEAVVPDPINNLQAVKSSSDGKRMIIKFGDLISPKFIIFNSETKVFETLPDNITAAAFSPDNKKIAYLERATGNLMTKDLIVVKPKTTKVLSLNQKDFDLEWVLPNEIILMPKPSALYLSSIRAIDIKNKTISVLEDAASGLMIKWSASGKLGLKFSSQTIGGGGHLNLINEQGAMQAGLDFITLPDKCFISEPKIYCAIPDGIPANSVLPDDYLKRAIYFKDSLYQIDTSQNSMVGILSITDPALDAVNLTLAGGKLLFINRYDNNLYSLEL